MDAGTRHPVRVPRAVLQRPFPAWRARARATGAHGRTATPWGPLLLALLWLLAALLVHVPAAEAASLTEIEDFGENPSGLTMHLYTPEGVGDHAPVLVALHWCHGSGPEMHRGTEFRALADRYGFLVVYPTATRSDGCFDVSSRQALHRGGGSDPVGIAAMVDHLRGHHRIDPERVFVAGVSSGAMMTNVLLAEYPERFAAGAAFAGVPFGCFAGPRGWNDACADGRIDRSPEEWAERVRAAHPGHTGPRPRVQLWHGTEDGKVDHANLAEETEQWTTVLGVPGEATSRDTPAPGWHRSRFADASGTVRVEAISLDGVPHHLLRSGMAARAVAFFGLDESGPS